MAKAGRKKSGGNRYANGRKRKPHKEDDPRLKEALRLGRVAGLKEAADLAREEARLCDSDVSANQPAGGFVLRDFADTVIADRIRELEQDSKWKG